MTSSTGPAPAAEPEESARRSPAHRRGWWLAFVVFGLFFALLIVCAIRGLSLHAWALWHKFEETPVGVKRKRESAALPLPSRSGDH